MVSQLLGPQHLTDPCIIIKDNFIIFAIPLEKMSKPNKLLQVLYYACKYQYYCEPAQKVQSYYSYLNAAQQKKLYKYGPKANVQVKGFTYTDRPFALKGKAKLIGSYKLTGTLLLSIILNHYNDPSEQIDLNFMPQIIKREELRRIDEMKYFYLNSINMLKESSQSESILLDADELDIKHRQIIFESLQNIIPDALSSFIREDYEKLTSASYEESRNFCNQLFDKLKSDYIQDNTVIYDQADVFVKSKQRKFEEIQQTYLIEAKGAYKQQLLAVKVPIFLFEQFDSWFDQLMSYYSSEVNRSKAQVLSLQENFSECQIRLNEMESKKFDMENLNQTLMFELESSKREVHKLSSLNKLQEENFDRQIKDLRQKYANSKDKKKDYKEKLEKTQQEKKTLTLDIQEKTKEIVSYLMKIEHLEKALESTIQNKVKRNSLDNVTSLQDDLFHLMRDFRDNLSHAETQIIKNRDSVKTVDFRQSTQGSNSNYLMNKFETLEGKYKKLKQQSGEQAKQIQLLQEEIDTLKKKNRDQEFIIKQQDIQIKALQETQPLQEAIQKDQSKVMEDNNVRNEDFMKVLLNHKSQIEKINQEYYTLQNQYYEASIKLADLNCQKFNLLTILREALKHAKKQPNTLNTILKTMSPDIQSEIKDTLHQAGLKV